MKIFLDLIAPNPMEIAWGAFSAVLPVLLVAAVVIVAAIFIIRAVRKKK